MNSRIYMVRGSSMLPSFRPGELLLVHTHNHHSSVVTKGDVVIFRDPKGTQKEFLKRIVGLPKDQVDLSDGILRINREYIYTKYLGERTLSRKPPNHRWRLHENEFFMLGDLRTFSTDSRTLGPISTKLLVGTVWCRIWPPRRWQIF